MPCSCNTETITVYQGFSTFWNSRSLIDVNFESDIDLSGFSAIFKILNIEKRYTDISTGFSIDLTKQETAKLPIGLNYGELIIEDNTSHKRPFTTALPIEVKNWVSGDIHLDNFNIEINTKIKENNLKIKIETPAEAPTIQIGTVESVQPDEEPYIVNVGTSSNQIWNFGIPKGEDGENASIIIRRL